MIFDSIQFNKLSCPDGSYHSFDSLADNMLCAANSKHIKRSYLLLWKVSLIRYIVFLQLALLNEGNLSTMLL
ncbi:hypothetical protein LFADAHJC_LOCUS4393 [Methylorubrum extorquens]